MMFADDIILCGKCKEEVEVKIESWRDALWREEESKSSGEK